LLFANLFLDVLKIKTVTKENLMSHSDFVFFTINSEVYETQSKDDAIQKYLSQIEVYPKNAVFLVNLENPNLVLDNSPTFVTIKNYNLINDGQKFHIDVTTLLENGVIYDFFDDALEELKTFLVSKGLTLV
jgi:hypothetical protein